MKCLSSLEACATWLSIISNGISLSVWRRRQRIRRYLSICKCCGKQAVALSSAASRQQHSSKNIEQLKISGTSAAWRRRLASARTWRISYHSDSAIDRLTSEDLNAGHSMAFCQLRRLSSIFFLSAKRIISEKRNGDNVSTSARIISAKGAATLGVAWRGRLV